MIIKEMTYMKNATASQIKYINTLVDRLGGLSYGEYRKLAQLCGAKTFEMMTSEQASQMITSLKKATEDREYQKRLITYLSK